MSVKHKYNKGTGRSYKYDTTYESSPTQKKNRAERNKARRDLGLKKGDPREADHIDPLAKGGSNSKRNLEVTSEKANKAKRDRFSGRVR